MANKEMKSLLASLDEQGWTVTLGKHYRCVPPTAGAPIVIISATASDKRAMSNARADLRRSGWVEPGR